MTWQLAALLIIVTLCAAALLISISSMLALRIGDAVVAAWRWCRRRLA